MPLKSDFLVTSLFSSVWINSNDRYIHNCSTCLSSFIEFTDQTRYPIYSFCWYLCSETAMRLTYTVTAPCGTNRNHRGKNNSSTRGKISHQHKPLNCWNNRQEKFKPTALQSNQTNTWNSASTGEHYHRLLLYFSNGLCQCHLCLRSGFHSQ